MFAIVSSAVRPKRIILERNASSEDLEDRYVDVYDFLDVWRCGSKGLLLPYRVFTEDQRVSWRTSVQAARWLRSRHNRRANFEVKVKINREKDGYQKRRRQICEPDYLPKIPPKALNAQTAIQLSAAQDIDRSYEILSLLSFLFQIFSNPIRSFSL